VRILREKGLTLIEMVVIIVVIGIAIPVLMRMWSDVAIRSADSETVSDATFFAQELMEQIRSKKFVDLDAYNGYLDTPANGYTRKVAVNYRYLDTGNSTWKDSATATDYKYIKVTVERTKTPGGSFSVSTLVARE
jgi:type II secretory pathway pseudopilin PulG